MDEVERIISRLNGMDPERPYFDPLAVEEAVSRHARLIGFRNLSFVWAMGPRQANSQLEGIDFDSAESSLWSQTTQAEFNTGTLTDTATVTVTVQPINDPPMAVDDSGVTNEDEAVVIDVLDNDSDVDGDSLHVDSAAQPANGTVVITLDYEILYTPDTNYNGVDSFSYVVSDSVLTDTAIVTVTVTSMPDPPAPAPFDVSSSPKTVPPLSPKTLPYFSHWLS